MNHTGLGRVSRRWDLVANTWVDMRRVGSSGCGLDALGRRVLDVATTGDGWGLNAWLMRKRGHESDI